MKKIGLFLLAAVLAVGMAGCGGGGDDFPPTVANMAGVYTPTKATATVGASTVTINPPDISGTMSLTAVGTYTANFILGGDHVTGSGNYVIVDETIIVDGGDASGVITDDGRKFTLTYLDGS